MSYEYAFAEVYDALIGEEANAERGAYIVEALRRCGVENGVVLDLACGTGGTAAALVNAGYETIAADVSADMLALARQRLGDRALFLCQDMRELDLYGTVRAAVCTLDGINHLLTPEDVLAAFSRVSLFTEPGGVFLFDVNTPFKHRRVLADNVFVYETDDCYLTWQNFPAEDPDLVEMQLDIFRRTPAGGYRRDTEEFAERAYPRKTLERLLRRAGFSAVRCFADLSFEPPAKNAERLCFAAIKR